MVLMPFLDDDSRGKPIPNVQVLSFFSAFKVIFQGQTQKKMGAP